MPTQPDHVLDLLKDIHHELTIQRARLNEALNMFTSLNLPSVAEATCEFCGAELAGPRTLAEHVYVSHGGPMPDDPFSSQEVDR